MAQTTDADPDMRVPRRVYRTTLDIVEERTEPGMGPYLSQFGLIGRMLGANIDRTIVNVVIDRLVEKQELVRYQTHEVAHKGEGYWLTLATNDRIVRWLKAEANSENVDAELIAALNQKQQQITDDT